MDRAQEKSISVIVPCYEATKTLKASLLAINAAINYSRLESDVDEAELIVVDDFSRDDSAEIAKEFSTNVIHNSSRQGASRCRNIGASAAKSSILVFVDSDVLIEEEHLSLILDTFSQNPEIDAVTGLLSADAAVDGFFSHYKNIYMNFIFSKQQREVNFIYGSIYALRREVAIKFVAPSSDKARRPAEDTRLGIRLAEANRKILLLSELEVKHLKNYSFASLLRNDFNIPFRWAKIFFAEGGWKQLGKNGSGFAHASKRQLVSLLLAPVITLPVLLGIASTTYLIIIYLIWFTLNIEFFLFIQKKRGFWFALGSLVFTLVDHHVMLAGVLIGMLSVLFYKYKS